MAVSNWKLDWIKTMTQECIRNSLTITGLVPKCDFELAKLHPPLKALFEAMMTSRTKNGYFLKVFDMGEKILITIFVC
jgi:hypothetical protein